MKIVRLYNELLGTYGDRGNAEVLAHRARKSGIASEIIEINYLDEIPEDGDIYFLGGAEDKAQLLVTEKLSKTNSLKNILNEGKLLVAICASYQILGSR